MAKFHGRRRQGVADGQSIRVQFGSRRSRQIADAARRFVFAESSRQRRESVFRGHATGCLLEGAGIGILRGAGTRLHGRLSDVGLRRQHLVRNSGGSICCLVAATMTPTGFLEYFDMIGHKLRKCGEKVQVGGGKK